jgi:transcriptional regulator with XRE-family HTH domain
LKTLGQTLREFRQDYGWKQTQAAAKAGIGRVTIGKIENGVPVLPSTVEKYAAIFGTTRRELLEEEHDDFDEETRDIARGYRKARTPVRQAISALLGERTGFALALLVLAIAPRLAEDPKGVEARVRQALDTPPPPLSE